MKRAFLIGWILAGTIVSCTHYSPKPLGYMRFEPAAPRYVSLPVDSLPYSFSVSDRVNIELPEEGQDGWINLVYDEFRAKIYCSYLPATTEELPELEKESLMLAGRMSAVEQAEAYQNPEQNVAGLLFSLSGNVASPIQFYLTDSVSRFFRGALYYETTPNTDSIAPVTAYLREDIIELISTFSWKD